jgi:hypothetical protein
MLCRRRTIAACRESEDISGQAALHAEMPAVGEKQNVSIPVRLEIEIGTTAGRLHGVCEVVGDLLIVV